MRDEPRHFGEDVVIVTGAGGGLGRDYALQFAARGAKVVANGRPRDSNSAQPCPITTLVDTIRAAGGEAAADFSDITTAQGAQALVDHALKAFGTLSVLVSNAGIISFASFEDLTLCQWDDMRRVTIDAAFHLTKAAWPVFKAAGHGRVVLTTSNSGYAGTARLAHYGAMKMALIGLTRCLACESEQYGITVNAVAPMAITAMNRDMFNFDGTDNDTDWPAAIAAGKIPIGPPSIVTPTVLWLAHRSTRVNGKIISSSSGKVASLKIGLSEGYFDPAHDVDDLFDHQDAILSGTGLANLDSPFDEIEDIARHFTGWAQ